MSEEHSLTHSITHSLSLPPSLPPSLPHSLFCVAGAALGALQGLGCTPWHFLVSAALPVAFAWQVRHLVLWKGSDVRPGVPWSRLLRGRCGTWCTAKGSVYALASLGLRRSAGSFCVAGVALGALQGVGCTPWRPLVSAALPVAFAWQVRHLVLCKGSDVRPGIPWSPPLVALPVAFAWQVRHLVFCKGSDIGPGVPSSPPLCRWLLRGRRGTMCTAKGSDVRPGVFCMAGVGRCALPRARMYAPVAFAWLRKNELIDCVIA